MAAEHAYGARRSAWRKATQLLAASPVGGSAPRPLSKPVTQASTGRADSSVVFEEEAVSACGGGGLGERRDPAFAMCKYLRGLGMLAGGDVKAAAGQMEVTISSGPSPGEGLKI